ncbi:MAG: hypothetical protein NTY20_03310 [Candidatus Aenigmarchaeota archaeon]|nr:hypothetical protein [Candidatus Aenigmarchaeota archaeon]
MKFLWVFLALVFLGIFPNPALGFDYALGTGIYTKPTLSQPAKGSAYIDPNFNTIITRVTDKAIDGYGGTGGTLVTYSTVSTYNPDDTYFISHAQNGDWNVYQGPANSNPYQFVRKIIPISANPPLPSNGYIIDSLSEIHYNETDYPVYSSATKVYQSFTGNGAPLKKVKFYLKKEGNPTGNAYVKLYTHSGTFGVDSVPTGSPLASSDSFDVSTMTTSYQLITFEFTAPYTLVNGTYYCLVLEPPAGTQTNRVVAGANWAGKPVTGLGGWNHPGNLGAYISPAPGWFPVYDDDLIFYAMSDTPGVSTVIDYYPESNQDSALGIGHYNPGGGQSIIGDGRPLGSVKLSVSKWPGATGTCYVKVYNETHATAFGTDSVPAGSPLATSNGVSLSDIPDAGSWALTSFNFSSPVTLTDGGKYVITLEFDDPTHPYWEVFMEKDVSSPTHAGNICYLNMGDPTWHVEVESGKDLIFYAMAGAPPPYTVDGTDSTPHWDPADPDLLYYIKNHYLQEHFEGPKLYSYRVSTGAETVVHDFTTGPGISQYFTGTNAVPCGAGCTGHFIDMGEGNEPSKDGRYWPLWVAKFENGTAHTKASFVYDKQTDTVVGWTNDCNKIDCNADKGLMAMSPNGTYVLARANISGTSGFKVFDKTFATKYYQFTGFGNTDVAIDSKGHEIVFGADDEWDSHGYIDLTDGTRYALLARCCYPCNSNHYSGNSYTKYGWGVVSSYDDHDSFWDNSQVYMLELNSDYAIKKRQYGGSNQTLTPSRNARVWRLAHTHNYFSGSYDQQPHATISSTGKYVMWQGQWESSGVADDVYQITLPSTWYQDLSNPQSCSAQGGTACISRTTQICSGSWISASDSGACCLGTCQAIPDCINNSQITFLCLCGGSNYSAGYCCRNTWQSNSCFHRADTSQNNCIEMSELNAFIDKWKINNLDVTLKDLIEAIGLWKKGC